MILSILKRTAATQLIVQVLGFTSQFLILATLQPTDYKLYVLLALTLSLYSAVDNPISFSILSRNKNYHGSLVILFTSNALIAFVIMAIYTITMTDFSLPITFGLFTALIASISAKFFEILLIKNKKYTIILKSNIYTRIIFALTIIFTVFISADSYIIVHVAIAIQLITSIVYLIFVVQGVKVNNILSVNALHSTGLLPFVQRSVIQKFVILFVVSIIFKIIYLQFANVSDQKLVLFYLIALDAIFNVIMLTYKFSFSIPSLEVKVKHFVFFLCTALATSTIFILLTGGLLSLINITGATYIILITIIKTFESMINVYLRETL